MTSNDRVLDKMEFDAEMRRLEKVALTALMRKLLVTANAIARDRQPWKHA